MSEDMPWVNGLTDEEVQELRNKKQELTQYGKEKIRELMNDGKLRIYDKGKETFAVEDPYWGGQSPETQLHIKKMTEGYTMEPYPDEMFEEAERREAANKVMTAKVSNEDLEKVMDAATRQELAKKSFEELTKQEKIQLALEEIDWLVIGGQDGEEFYNSIQFIRKVLRSLV